MNDGWAEEAGLRWRICQPFGVEIASDLAKPLPPAAAARFVNLFRDHALVVARGQSLDRAQHDAVMSLIGPVIAQRDGDTGYMRSDGGTSPGTSALSWQPIVATSR